MFLFWMLKKCGADKNLRKELVRNKMVGTTTEAKKTEH